MQTERENTTHNDTQCDTHIVGDTEYEYITTDNVDENLLEAVSSVKYEEVRRWLSLGADPNLDNGDSLHRYEYFPRTSMTLLVFRFSDCLLSDNQVQTYLDIARLLISAGAHTEDAKRLFIMRYGDPRETEETNDADPYIELFNMLK
jgi:hypothetical protein